MGSRCAVYYPPFFVRCDWQPDQRRHVDVHLGKGPAAAEHGQERHQRELHLQRGRPARAKKVSGTVTSYILHGKNVVQLTQGSNNLHFFYGADGSPAMVVYNGAGYGYVKNLQGDIVSIVNSSGTEVVHYTYDAWGRLMSKTGTLATSLGTLNPFGIAGMCMMRRRGCIISGAGITIRVGAGLSMRIQKQGEYRSLCHITYTVIA